MDDVGETWDLYNRWRDEYLLLKRVLRSSRTVGSVARATDIRPRKAPPPEIADAFVSPDVEELMSG